jgi:hypothetical protein
MGNMRESSKNNWTSDSTIEEINAGSLQRIADATEVMAQNYLSLQNDRDMYKRWYKNEVEKKEMLQRKISSQKGVITKLKNKIDLIKQLENELKQITWNY